MTNEPVTLGEVYRAVERIERLLDGPSGLVERVKGCEDDIEQHWHPGLVDDLQRTRIQLARTIGIAIGAVTAVDMALRIIWHI